MNARKILEEKKLNITRARISILNILIQSNKALSETEIEKQTGSSVNRTTIYRTLTTFTENEIVRRIIIDKLLKYVFSCNTAKFKHQDEHIHFKCNICGEVICLSHLKVRDYELPKGFTRQENNFLILGICNKCNKT